MRNIRWASLAAVALGLFVFRLSGDETAPPRPVVMTRWAQEPRTKGEFWAMAYPRTRVIRPDGIVLDGLWEFATTDPAANRPPTAYPRKALVPFPIGSALSRVSPIAGGARFWYRQTVDIPKYWDLARRRLMLHFKAVDSDAVIFVNQKQVGSHKGAEDSFSFDITDVLVGGRSGAQEIVVGVTPSSAASAHPGIWQTVWVEPVPPARIEDVHVIPDLDAGVVHVTDRCVGDVPGLRVEAAVFDRGEEVGHATGKPGEPLTLAIRSPKTWSPAHPFIYDLRVALKHDDQRLDEVANFFGMRKISVGKEGNFTRILLNNQFTFEAGVLDTGRWPEGGATPPAEMAVRKDLEAIRQLGFNMVRKSGKVESDYWYYVCDRLGILVWQDVPISAGADDADREKELATLVDQREDHPSIVAWVVSGKDAARDAKILKSIDPTRLVIDVGGDSGIGDAIDVAGEFAAGSTRTAANAATVIGDLGRVPSGGMRPDFTREFAAVWDKVGALRDSQGLSAAIYRQLTDDEQSDAGLLSASRAIFKIDLAALATHAKSPLSPQVKVVVPAGISDSGDWLYTDKTAGDWAKPDFDTTSWKHGPAPFGAAAPGDSHPAVATPWNGGDLWMRREFTVGVEKLSNPWLLARQTAEVEVFINGVFITRLSPGVTAPGYVERLCEGGAREAMRPGQNVLALHCRGAAAAGTPFVDIGLVEILPQRDCLLPTRLDHWPLIDAFMRDTCICLAPDGNFYLTGTTGDWGKEGIRIWKSTDLKNWQDLGLVWTPEKNVTWQMRGRKRENFRLWAPEIHFFKGTFWLPYCTSYAESKDIQTGTGILKSTTGKAEGPYEDVSPNGPLTEGLDASLFEDDDGKMYFLHGGSNIARMKDDMTGLAEKPHDLHVDTGGTVGYEGVYLFKAKGKYYLGSTFNSLPERDYDCFVAVSDKIEGPYHNRQLAIPHGGHNMFFQDKQGKWWSTIFGGDVRAPFIHRPGLIPIEFAPDGTIHPAGG